MTLFDLFSPVLVGLTTAGYSFLEGCVLASIGIAIANNGNAYHWASAMATMHFIFYLLSYIVTHTFSADFHSYSPYLGEYVIDNGAHIITLLIIVFFIFGTVKKISHLHGQTDSQVKTNSCGSNCLDNRNFLERITNYPVYTVLISASLSLDAFLHGLVIRLTVITGNNPWISYTTAALTSSIAIGLMVLLGVKGGGERRLTATKKGAIVLLVSLLAIFFLTLFNLFEHGHG